MNILKLFFSPGGKIHRVPFLVAHIVYWIIGVVVAHYTGLTTVAFEAYSTITLPSSEMYMNFHGFIALVVLALVVYSTVCVYIKRLRDADHDPLFTLFILTVPVNVILFIFLLFCPTKNR